MYVPGYVCVSFCLVLHLAVWESASWFLPGDLYHNSWTICFPCLWQKGWVFSLVAKKCHLCSGSVFLKVLFVRSNKAALDVFLIAIACMWCQLLIGQGSDKILKTHLMLVKLSFPFVECYIMSWQLWVSTLWVRCLVVVWRIKVSVWSGHGSHVTWEPCPLFFSNWPCTCNDIVVYRLSFFELESVTKLRWLGTNSCWWWPVGVNFEMTLRLYQYVHVFALSE